MTRLPEINKQNWKKALRELDIAKFPSLPDILRGIRDKLINKTELTFLEQNIGFAGMFKYVERYTQEMNSFYLQNLEFTKFKKRAPYEFQKEGVRFLLKNNRCILCDDMGLGKTMTTVYSVLSMEDSHKVLVVTLKSLKYNFANEIKVFDQRVAIVNKKWVQDKFTIIHYDAFKKYQKQIIEGGFSIVILDEVHKIRNHKTQRAKAVNDAIRVMKPTKVWLLTGTPIDNRPSDYYSLLHLIKHPVADNWIRFIQRYCGGFLDSWGHWNTGGATNLEELYTLTQDVFLRRLKSNVGIEMPKKQRHQVVLELENVKGYNKVIEDYRQKKHTDLVDEVGFDKGLEAVGIEKITEIMLHRQFCALEKIRDGSLIELIESKLEENDSNKVIVFTNFTKVVDAVHEHFGKEVCNWLDGRILDPKKRQEIVDDFNDNPLKRVFVINMKVGGTGYNIQGANIVIVNDMDWVPSSMLQAEDRAWRIGQKRDVEVMYLIYDNTVETILYETIEEKMRIISTVVEGKAERYFDESFLTDGEAKKKQDRMDLIREIMAQLG